MDLEVEGSDNLSLLYNFLDEFLYSFSVEPNFIASKVEILNFDEVSRLHDSLTRLMSILHSRC